MTPRPPATSTPLRGACRGAAAALAVLLAARSARADDAAVAKALFDHGLEDMSHGRYDTGCPAIAESYQLNPLPGALFTLAECEAKRGRLATAVKRYEEYLTLFARLSRDKQQKQHGRDAISKQRVAELAPQIPGVTVVLPADAPAGVVVTIDGVPVARSALPGPIPIDPGDHTLFAAAPGASTVEQRFSVAKAEQKTVPIELKAAAGAAGGATAASPDASPPGNGLRIAAFVVGGLGLASVVAGAVTGGLAISEKGTIQKNCTLNDTTGVASCNPAGLSAGHTVTTLGAASTGTLIAGGVAVGAAVALFVASTWDRPATPGAGGAPPVHALLSVGPGTALLGVQGAF